MYSYNYYGYSYNSKGRLIPKKKEQQVIKSIIEMRNKKYTFRYIAQELKQLNIPPPNKEWNVSVVQYIYSKESKL